MSIIPEKLPGDEIVSEVKQINELVIIGYNDVLDSASLPAVVAPVFRDKKNTNNILFPPFRVIEDVVVGGTWASDERWNGLVALGEMSQLERPFTAQPDHELWVDLDGKTRYEPRHKARHSLQKLAQRYLDKARKALANGNREESLEFAGIAFNADTRQVDPLAIKAAIRRFNGQHQAADFLADLATAYCSADSFWQMVNDYTPWQPSNRPMKDVAAEEPEQAEHQLFAEAA